MTSYFDEKAEQVDTGHLVAFGIKIISRYSKAGELIEMLSFAKKAALAGVADSVQEVFYDSNACFCTFEFNGDIVPGDPIEQKIFAAAKATISQFEWMGCIHHRDGEDER